MNAGGFLTARGFVDGTPFRWALGPYWYELHDGNARAVASTPDHGMTPIPLSFASQAGGGNAPAGTFVATATVPKASIEAIVRIFMR